ncbi:MAG: hypothetical protein V4594_13485 [Bacteroidota bacterium]
MKQLRYPIGVVLFLLFLGCGKDSFDRADFSMPQRIYDIAVEGGINTLISSQYIRLTKPSLIPDSLPAPIRNASVTVNDSKTDILFKETSIPGVYMGVNRNDPNYNKAYKLTIKYDGKTYTAEDTLRQVVNIVDDFLPLSTHNAVNKSIMGSIPKHTFGYINPNKWFIAYLDIPLWNPSKFDQTKYYSYTHLLGSPNSLYPLNNLKRDFTLGEDDYVSIFKISLSERYAGYLYSVFMETDWSGLFSSVPVNVKGNISGNAQGYFSVNDVDIRRYRAKEL